jgi:iron complex outermembrane recepter protein
MFFRAACLSGASPFALTLMLALSPSIARAASPTQLPTVDVNGADAPAPSAPEPLAIGADSPPPIVQKYQLPQQVETITSQEIEQTINLKDPEDAIKYLPSLFVRKRNDGDNQAVLATRTWGVNSSARTLIYADDILLSALINNNNTNGSPHWNLVAPESIARIDFLEGPYAAAYPGNSIGGVLLITTKMPDQLLMTAKQTESIQPFNQYGTNHTFVTHQTSAALGDRHENFSWLLNFNYLDSYAQPLTYTTSATVPAATAGTFLALNKQGLTANVLGTGALTHSQQIVTNLKLAYDFTPWLQGRYTLGFWSNDQNSNPASYLTSTATGGPTFGGVAGFAGNNYQWTEQHLANALSLASDTHGAFDFDVAISTYNYLTDIQRYPFTVTPTGIGFSEIGKVQRMDGTNWQNADLKGVYRPFGINGPNELSFGLHGDRYVLNNPTYQTPAWNFSSDTGNGQFYSNGQGKTQTGALWAQDMWKILPNLKLTVGTRLEAWNAFDGLNVSTTTSSAGAITSTKSVFQPSEHSVNASPKASLTWSVTPEWDVIGSFGEAYRYPTVGELYQTVTSGSTIVIPNPNLTPEQDLSTEVNVERKWVDGKVRLSIFQETVHNALISQTNFVNAGSTQVAVTSVGNVDAIRNQGVELAAQKNNVLFKGVELFGNITYVDARILSDPTWAGSNPLTGKPDTVVGKRVPYVPDWRSTIGVTYRPDAHWAFTAAARYSGKQYSTLDNTDIIPHVYGAFDRFIVVDTRIHYDATENVAFDFGIDNLNNEKYFLFHPFPGRTFVADARIKF